MSDENNAICFEFSRAISKSVARRISFLIMVFAADAIKPPVVLGIHRHKMPKIESSQPVGYVVVPYPNTATFRAIGRNHVVSFIPESHFANPITGTTICVWLGASDEYSDVLVFLIWPNKGLVDFSPGLNKEMSSRVLMLTGQTAQFTLTPPTIIARDLMLFNQFPCLLFIHCRTDINAVQNEALSICFSTRVTDLVTGLASFLESNRAPGDVVSSSTVADWYRVTTATLKKANREDYLFDPTVLLKAITLHLFDSLQVNNKLDATSNCISIPLCFIREWVSNYVEEIERDTDLLKGYASLGRQ